jgi:glucose-6-phosphate isomerase
VRLTLRLPDSAADTGADTVASRIFAHDATIWGAEAEAEASIRLGWVDLPTTSRSLVDEVAALRAERLAQGLDHVVLCGMGGSSLAPEVICAAAGVPLTVLDSSHPDMVRSALGDRLSASTVVVSSKSGGTVETDSLMRAYVAAFEAAGLDPADHLVIVTDPGSPFDEEATAAGYRVFRADPNVGGRYSALSAFGIVPSGLAGADVAGLLDEAVAAQTALASEVPANPALRLGNALGDAYHDGVDKLTLFDASGVGLGDWIEQLVAESTGKIGRGILPVVVPSADAPNFAPDSPDEFLVVTGVDSPPQARSGYSAALTAGLGAQFLLWETAVAVAGQRLGINPFDQPDVESAKQAAREFLSATGTSPEAADVVENGMSAFGTSADSLADAITQLLAQVDPEHGYIAIHAYLDRLGQSAYADLRELVAGRTGRPVTFGWGPRFLHSTGQLHKGGPATGVYLQLTDDPAEDLQVPGREFTFGTFIAAQAAGDAHILRGHGRPVLRLHLADAATALPDLRDLLA